MPLAAHMPRFSFPMPEAIIQALNTDDADFEKAAATRERLKGLFP